MFNVDEFKKLLMENGFTAEDVEKNWQKYLEAVLALSIDGYLKDMNEENRKMILGDDDTSTPDGLEKVKIRFMDYYQSHRDEFKPVLNQLNFPGKLKDYLMNK